jgi:hypothetical protein
LPVFLMLASFGGGGFSSGAIALEVISE